MTYVIFVLIFVAALDVVLFKTKALQSLSGKGDTFNVNGRVCVQMSAAHELAQSFTSCFPFFMRTMKSFNISGSYTLVGVPFPFLSFERSILLIIFCAVSHCFAEHTLSIFNGSSSKLQSKDCPSEC